MDSRLNPYRRRDVHRHPSAGKHRISHPLSLHGQLIYHGVAVGYAKSKFAATAHVIWNDTLELAAKAHWFLGRIDKDGFFKIAITKININKLNGHEE